MDLNFNTILKIFLLIIPPLILCVGAQQSLKARVGKTCTSSHFECAFNLTKEPRFYFSELSGAKPYNKICRYGGRLYQLGWNIAIAGDPCLNCICDERWDDRNPLESLSCKKTNCEPDLQIQLKAGCLPIYSSNECCPVDYYCRQQCVFNGTRYGIGTKLYMRLNRDNMCDECRCSAPPYFTCVSGVCTQRISDKIVLLKESDE